MRAPLTLSTSTINIDRFEAKLHRCRDEWVGVLVMNQNEMIDRLARQWELLRQIGVNTEIQRRFVRRRDLRGLRRLLREQAALLKELAAVNRELQNARESGIFHEESEKSQDLRILIAAQQAEIMERGRGVLQEAQREKERIGAEIKNVVMRKQLKMKYQTARRQTGAPGKRFNSKG